mmetsp:Transcript_90849/g.265974  ORF Transcript_90849/g.265974 Transcript_90849/m.265974 type:complete len:271 (+) Transcript_90849:608-1420(+)
MATAALAACTTSWPFPVSKCVWACTQSAVPTRLLSPDLREIDTASFADCDALSALSANLNVLGSALEPKSVRMFAWTISSSMLASPLESPISFSSGTASCATRKTTSCLPPCACTCAPSCSAAAWPRASPASRNKFRASAATAVARWPSPASAWRPAASSAAMASPRASSARRRASRSSLTTCSAVEGSCMARCTWTTQLREAAWSACSRDCWPAFSAPRAASNASSSSCSCKCRRAMVRSSIDSCFFRPRSFAILRARPATCSASRVSL